MDYDLDEITQNDGAIHIFSDGSYSYRTQKTGSAWVIATQDHKKPIVRSCNDNGGYIAELSDQALYAEFVAVAEALEDIPDDTKVRFHTDNSSVYFAINGLLSSGVIQPQRMTILNDLISRIAERMGKLSYFDIAQSNDNHTERDPLKRYYMTLAHNASAEASGSKNIKNAILGVPFKKATYPERTSNHKHDSSGAMEIIDFSEDNDGFEEPFEYGSPTPKSSGP